MEQHFSKIKSRILQHIDYQNISKRSFYAKTGIANGVLDKTTGLTEENISKYISTYPEINPDWLLTGNGDMLKSQQTSTSETFPQHISLPLVPFEALTGFADETQLNKYQNEHFYIPTFRGANFLFSVKGNGMHPKYNSGDIIACKSIPLNSFFQWNKAYLLDTTQGPLLKRIKQSTLQDHILLTGDNPEHEPFDIPLEHIHGLAIVLGVIRVE